MEEPSEVIEDVIESSPPPPALLTPRAPGTQFSLTEGIREFLTKSARSIVTSEALARQPLEDVYMMASQHGMTLYDFIQWKPQHAIRAAEACLHEWTQILSEASLTGVIDTNAGTTKINKNIADMLKARVDTAQKALDTVMGYAMSAVEDGTLRKDQVIQTLYNQAIVKGNTRALMYLVDRIEGRVGEAKVADYDYSNTGNVVLILYSLFPKQLDVFHSGPGTKIICCSRRAGKTHLSAALILIECLRKPNVTCLYIGKTMELAEGLLHEAMNEIIDTCKLKDSKGARLNFKKFDNGSKILIRGLSNTKDPDMIRGHKAKVIVIDEFFHMTEDGLLEYMINEVLEPMQMDFASDHTMLFIGTPPKVKGTYGEKVWIEATEIPHFKWTYKDNPFPLGEDKEKYIDEKLRKKGLDRTSPYAQREYGGEFVYDEDALLYPAFTTYDPAVYQPQLNVTNIYCGIDYGMSDCNAVVGVAWDQELRRGFVFFESKYNRLQVDKTISMLEHLKREVTYLWEMAFDFFPGIPKYEANKKIYWDADSNAQSLTEELKFNVRCREDSKLALQIKDAHKTDKVLMHDKIRDLLRSASLLLPQSSKITLECEKTIMLRDENGNITQEIDDKYYHPDLLDSLRYALWNAVGQEVRNEKSGVDFSQAERGFIEHNNSGTAAYEQKAIDDMYKGSATGSFTGIV